MRTKEQLRSLSSSFLALLTVVVANDSAAQVQWSCLPVSFTHEVRTTFVDSTDSTLYVGGAFGLVNGQPDTAIIGIRLDGSLRHLPYPKVFPVTVITKWNGKLIAGGFGGFSEYDGSSWRKLDSNGAVFGLYPYQGKLLVGGAFQNPQNPSTTYRVLQEWDGSTMRSFKGLDSIFISYAISSIIEYKGDLIVAGNVDPYAPVNPRFKEIARWTGTSWQPLGNGITGGGNDMVYDMKVIGDDLYVAGIFREAWGGQGNSIARWDGNQWHRLGDGLGIGTVGVYDLETQGDTLIVTGTFNQAGGTTAYTLARYWNGHWCGNDVQLGNAALSAVNYYGTVIVAGGFNTVGTDTCGKIAKVTSWGNCFAQATAGVSPAPEGSASGLRVSPNPSTGLYEIRCESKASTRDARLMVSNAMGQVVLSRLVALTSGANHIDLDLSALPAGLYHLQLSSASGHEAIKIVKQ